MNITAATDVAVIGSGAAGLSAALTALEGGARVIVFEKQRSLGGTSNFFYGTFAVESEMQRPRFIDYTRDQAFRNIMEYSHWRANPRLVRAIVNESSKTISWLQKQGVVFIEATINIPDGPRTYHTIQGTGEALVKALVTRIKEKGGEIRPATPVKQIFKEGGCIAGVMAEMDGEDVRVNSRAVVVASGGYANNKEWIRKFAGLDLGVNVFPVGNVDKTGDGIGMAWEAGAAEEGIGVLELMRAGPLGDGFELMNPVEVLGGQPDLWVDIYGQRFCNEGICFSESSLGNASVRGKKNYTFSLFDDSIKQFWFENGIVRYVGPDYLPGTRPAGVDRIIQNAIDNGSHQIFKAGSIEELARQIEVDPEVLRATIVEYNSYCAKGHDDLFAKDPRYLHPLIGPQYYAVKARTVCLGTMGGIKINERAEVMDKKDKVIPGLFAGGYDAGGMYGDSYSIQDSSGLSSAFALNSGRIAGKNALKYLGTKIL